MGEAVRHALKEWFAAADEAGSHPLGGEMPADRILFVDDDPTARAAFSRALRSRGFLVDLAGSGEEAWELATHFPYAVIATDLTMSGMDGMMLIEQLRELQPDPVCLLVTGKDQGAQDERVGQVDVIQKPWSTDQLVEALRQAVQSFHLRSPERFVSEPPVSVATHKLVLVGLSEPLARKVTEWLQGTYTIEQVCGRQQAGKELESSTRAVCVIAAGHAAEAGALRKLCRAAGRAPVVALASPANGLTPPVAVRHGAQDCLSESQLERDNLARVLELAFERARVPARDVPLCAPHENPGLLEDRVRQALSRAKRCGTHAGLLVLGLDALADVNQSLGFEAADELLCRVGTRLRNSVRESDAVFWLDEEQFAVVVEDLDRPSLVVLPARRVLSAFATPFRWGDDRLMLSVSVGAAVGPSEEGDSHGLIREARTALDAARRAGRGKCQLPRGLGFDEPFGEGQEAAERVA